MAVKRSAKQFKACAAQKQREIAGLARMNNRSRIGETNLRYELKRLASDEQVVGRQSG
jgi:hypothetical protein